MKRLKNFLENVFSWRSLEKFLWRPFFFFWRSPEKFLCRLFFFGEHLCLCPWSLALASSIPVLGLESVCPRKGYPWPWPQIFFVSLASSLVSSTPPLPLHDLQIPVSPFSNWLSIGSLNPFISPLLSPAWFPLECLVPRLLLLQQHYLEFPMGPRSRWSLGNENADLLAKAGASLRTDAIPCPLPTVIAKIRYLQYHNWIRHISHSYLNYQVPKVPSEELLLSRPIHCELSSFRCHGHSLLFSSYLHRISRKENSACIAVDTLYRTSIISSLTVVPLNPFVNLSLTPLSLLDLWSRRWGVARLLGVRGVPSRPHPSEGVG